MSVEFKESLFRFIVPPSLFFTGIFLSGWPVFWHIDTELFFVSFVTCGFIIAATGACVGHFIDYLMRAPWQSADGELKNWRQNAQRPQYIRDKIERTWNFYVLNLDCLIALTFMTILVGVQLYSSPIEHRFLFLSFGLSAVFAFLAYKNYTKTLSWAK